MAKVTIQTTDVSSPVVNTTIYEVEDIPLEEKELRNLLGFLMEAKRGPFMPEVKEEEKEEDKPLEIVTDDKS
tara:strand:+ start:15510 stop:15725 length:216 start_codon:yes stop_codon:yes gene_type:complete